MVDQLEGPANEVGPVAAGDDARLVHWQPSMPGGSGAQTLMVRTVAANPHTDIEEARVSLLDIDPDFAATLPPADRQAAARELVVPVFDLDVGSWDPPSGDQPGHLGFLIVFGVLTREVVIGESRSIELLNRADLLRPWQEDAASFTSCEWQVLAPTRLASMEPPLGSRLARYPECVNALLDRAMLRSRNVALNNTITNTVGLDKRIMLLFWHLAERWGTVSSDGVVIPIALTHQLISDLVGARRPSVTTAISTLAQEGRLARLPGEGWVLQDEAPVAEPAAPQEKPAASGSR